jgi:hypothetical protein
MADLDDNRQGASETDWQARLAAVEAEKADLVRRIEALEARPAKVELGEEFDGIRQLSYHLQHGGLTPFLADRAWWPNLGWHLVWVFSAIIVFAIVGYTLDEVLGII